jgi:hypothetical protein
MEPEGSLPHSQVPATLCEMYVNLKQRFIHIMVVRVITLPSLVSGCQLFGGPWYICLQGRGCVRMRLVAMMMGSRTQLGEDIQSRTGQ